MSKDEPIGPSTPGRELADLLAGLRVGQVTRVAVFTDRQHEALIEAIRRLRQR